MSRLMEISRKLTLKAAGEPKSEWAALALDASSQIENLCGNGIDTTKENEMKVNARIIVAGIIAGTLGGWIFYTFTLIATLTSLKERLHVSEMSNRIASDQISDLQYQLTNLQNQSEFHEAKGFVSGAIDSLKRPDYYSQIWHDGYDRGEQNEKYAISHGAGQSILQTKN